MSETPQPSEPPKTPVQRLGGNDLPTNGSTTGGGSALKDLYDDYLVRSDTALRDGRPLPPLPADLENTPFARQAESGVRLLKLLARARDTVMAVESAPLSSAAAPLDRVAHFRLVRELGRGGHGIVYLAVDGRLGRQVALKLSRPETLLDLDLRKRFLREAQAAGQLDHPQLVPVHEVGEEGRLFYIASQYVEGKDLAQWLSEQESPVPPRMAAELVAALAGGVEHAHAHGILHRDIKPSNVLLTEERGRISPRLTDFGLAKLREASQDQTQTRTGVLLGTPTYMAPELAAGKLREVGPGADVYGLGALLYEILTGRPPFRGENDADTLQQVIHQEPLDPVRLRPGLSRELAAICLKCLEKRPQARYGTAGELAADLGRYLRGQVTLARPATPLSRACKWAHRRPAVAGLSAALCLAILLSLTGGIWFSFRLASSLEEARTAKRLLEVQTLQSRGRTTAELARASQTALFNNNAPLANALLDGLRGAQGDAPFGVRWLRRVASGEEFRTPDVGRPIYALAVAHDGKSFASGSEDGVVRLWRSSDGELLHEFEHAQRLAIYALAFSPNDDLILSGGGNLTFSEVVVWDVPGRIRRIELVGPPLTVNAVAFSPDGRLAAAAGSGPGGDDGRTAAEVRLWEYDVKQRSAPGASPYQWFSEPRSLRSPAWTSAASLAFAPDAQTLAVGYGGHIGNGAIGLWDVAAGKEQALLTTDATAWSVAYADNGRRLVAGDWQGNLSNWSVPELELLGRGKVREGSRVMALAPSADGQRVYVASGYSDIGNPQFDVTEWDVSKAPWLKSALFNGAGECRGLFALPDGETLWGAGTAGVSCRWNLRRQTLWTCPITPAAAALEDFIWSADGSQLAALSGSQITVARLADGSLRTLHLPHGDKTSAIVFGATPRQLFALQADGSILLYDLERLDKPFEFAGPHLATAVAGDADPREPARLAIDYAGGCLAASGPDQRVRVWNVARRQLLFESPEREARVLDVRLSRDGALVAAAWSDRQVHVWRTTNQEALHAWSQAEAPTALAFSPDVSVLAIGGDQGTISIRALAQAENETSHHQPQELAQGAGITSLDYVSEGNCLAAGSQRGGVVLWQTYSGERMLQLPSLGRSTRHVRFAPNGKRLAAVAGPWLGVWRADDDAPSDLGAPPLALFSQPPPANEAPAAYAAQIRQVTRSWRSGELASAALRLETVADRWPGARRSFEMGYLRRQLGPEQAVAQPGGTGEATGLALTLDRKRAVVGATGGEISVIDLPSVLKRVIPTGAHTQAIAIAPPGDQAFVASRRSPWDVRSYVLEDGSERRIMGVWGSTDAVGVSPDGRWLLFGGYDQLTSDVRLRRWALLPRLEEAPTVIVASRNDHHEYATNIACFGFAPDSRTVAVGHGNDAHRGSSGMVTFWDLETGQEAPVRFTGFRHWVTCLGYSSDGRLLAAGSLDGTLRLWDPVDARPIATLQSEFGPIRSLAFSRDGQTLATGHAAALGPAKAGHVLLWDVRRRALAARLADLSRAVVGLSYGPDEQTLLALTADRSLRALPVQGRNLFRVIHAHEGTLYDMEFDRAGRLFTAGADRTLRQWDLEQGTEVRSQPELDEPIRGLAIAGQTEALATMGAARLSWRDPGTGKPVRSSGELPAELLCLTHSASGVCAAADIHGALHRWDAEGVLTTHPPSPWGAIEHLAFSDDLGRMAVSACAEQVVFWDTQYGNDLMQHPAGGRVRSLALSPDRKLVVAGCDTGGVRLWSVEDGKLLAAARLTGPVVAVAMSADGQTLAAATEAGTVYLLNVPTLEQLLVLPGLHEAVRELRFAPDNKRLVAGLANGDLLIWDGP